MLSSYNIDKNISILQATWKGKQTRSILLETRSEFEEIFYEIEQECNTGNTIQWTSNNLCSPKITKKEKSIVNKISPSKTEKSNLDAAVQSVKDWIEENNTNREDSDKDLDTYSYSKIVYDNKSTTGSRQKKKTSGLVEQSVFLTDDKTKQVVTSNSIEKSIESNHTNSSEVEIDDSVSKRLDKNDEIFNSGEPHIDDSVIQESVELKESSSDPNRESVEVNFNESAIEPLESTKINVSVEHNTTSRKFHKEKHNILTDSWMTEKSFDATGTITNTDDKSKEELLKVKENLSMELLWIDQAITSRKAYLKMKNTS